MHYTEEQISMMERLENGIIWEWCVDSQADEILHFLMDEGLCSPREDIKENLIVLSQKGKTVLSSQAKHRSDQSSQECSIQEDADSQGTVDGTKNPKNGNFNGFFYGVSVAVVAGLVIKYWDSIIAILLKLFHCAASYLSRFHF